VSYRPPVRDDLVGIAPYGAPHHRDAIALNVNENPFSPSAALIEAIAAAAGAAAAQVNRYPDREATALRADLGAYLSGAAHRPLPVDQIWAANGSNEVLHQCFAAFGGPGRRAITLEPSYSMYPEYARETFTEHITIARRPDFSIDLPAVQAAIAESRPALLVLATPNNPTGTATSLDVITQLSDWMEAGLLIVDEAYAEFSSQPSALTVQDSHPNVVVSRTMSKAFGLAGARVGYLAADPAIIDALQVVRLPYHLSSITQAVARAALGFADELREQIALICDERDRLALWLTDQGLTVVPSQANFLMFGRFADRDGVWRALLDHGVLVRQVLADTWLRVSMGTPDQNAIFRDALARVLPHFEVKGPT
jgi:histidinol-phosphate aminotransferase